MIAKTTYKNVIKVGAKSAIDTAPQAKKAGTSAKVLALLIMSSMVGVPQAMPSRTPKASPASRPASAPASRPASPSPTKAIDAAQAESDAIAAAFVKIFNVSSIEELEALEALSETELKARLAQREVEDLFKFLKDLDASSQDQDSKFGFTQFIDTIEELGDQDRKVVLSRMILVTYELFYINLATYELFKERTVSLSNIYTDFMARVKKDVGLAGKEGMTDLELFEIFVEQYTTAIADAAGSAASPKAAADAKADDAAAAGSAKADDADAAGSAKAVPPQAPAEAPAASPKAVPAAGSAASPEAAADAKADDADAAGSAADVPAGPTKHDHTAIRKALGSPLQGLAFEPVAYCIIICQIMEYFADAYYAWAGCAVFVIFMMLIAKRFAYVRNLRNRFDQFSEQDFNAQALAKTVPSTHWFSKFFEAIVIMGLISVVIYENYSLATLWQIALLMHCFTVCYNAIMTLPQIEGINVLIQKLSDTQDESVKKNLSELRFYKQFTSLVYLVRLVSVLSIACFVLYPGIITLEIIMGIQAIRLGLLPLILWLYYRHDQDQEGSAV